MWPVRNCALLMLMYIWFTILGVVIFVVMLVDFLTYAREYLHCVLYEI